MVSVEGSNVECECEHLTSFAVLMQIVPVREQCLTLYPVSLIGGLVFSNEYNIFVLFISQPLRWLCHRKNYRWQKYIQPSKKCLCYSVVIFQAKRWCLCYSVVIFQAKRWSLFPDHVNIPKSVNTDTRVMAKLWFYQLLNSYNLHII